MVLKKPKIKKRAEKRELKKQWVYYQDILVLFHSNAIDDVAAAAAAIAINVFSMLISWNM